MKRIKSWKLFESNTIPLTSKQIIWIECCIDIRGAWSFNHETGEVDIYTSFYCKKKEINDFRGVKFGTIKGNFNCSYNLLQSLEGAPHTVEGYFNCSNNPLSSLKYCPTIVKGDFDCSATHIKNLIGGPSEVKASYVCARNIFLESLEGAPREVGGGFSCEQTSIASLEGAPQKVGSFFGCSETKIASLIGGPVEVRFGYFCSNNPNLISLAGAPEELHGNFNCSGCSLTSLMGGPKKVDSSYLCKYNKLNSLIGAPEIVTKEFNCTHNPIKNLIGSPSGTTSFVAMDCELESLKGIPDGNQFWLDNNRLKDIDYLPRKISTLRFGNCLIPNTHRNGMLIDMYNEEIGPKEISEIPNNLELLSWVKRYAPPVWNVIKKWYPDGTAEECAILGDYGF